MGQKTLSKLLKNNAGFSLAEVMVAASILGVISLGVMEMTQNTNKTVKHAQQNVMILNIQQKIGDLLTDEGSCSENFNSNYRINTDLAGLGTGVSTTSGTVTELARYDFSDTPAAAINGVKKGSIAVVDQAYGTPPIHIESMGFTGTGHPSHPATAATAVPGAPGFNSRTAFLEVVFVRTSKASVDSGRTEVVGGYGNFKRSFFFELHVIENGAGNLVKCFADQSQFYTAFCNTLGGTYDTVNNTCDDLDLFNSDTGAVPSVTGHKIRVREGLYIGDDASADANTPTAGARITNGGLYVGTASSGNPAVGTGQFSNSISVGSTIAPTGTDGTARILNSVSIGSGVSPSGTNGELDVQTNLRVGTDTTITRDLNVNRSAAFGSALAPSGTNGDVQIARSLRVGTIAMPGAGGLSITGNERVNGTEYVVGTSRNDGDTWARGGLRVGSSASAPGNNRLYVGNSATHYAYAGDGLYWGILATKNYVNYIVSGETDQASRGEIMDYLMVQALGGSNDYNRLRSLIRASVFGTLNGTKCNSTGQATYGITSAGVVQCKSVFTARTCSGSTNFIYAINSSGGTSCRHVGNRSCSSYGVSNSKGLNVLICN